jgi:hypothetical protein
LLTERLDVEGLAGLDARAQRRFHGVERVFDRAEGGHMFRLCISPDSARGIREISSGIVSFLDSNLPMLKTSLDRVS